MPIELTIPVLLFGVLILLICILAPILLFLKRKKWAVRKKRIVFSLLSAFILFPVLMPAGTIAALPMPNIVLLILSAATFSIHEIPVWYFKTFIFCSVSYSITAILFFFIAHIIFFERRQG